MEIIKSCDPDREQSRIEINQRINKKEGFKCSERKT